MKKNLLIMGLAMMIFACRKNNLTDTTSPFGDNLAARETLVTSSATTLEAENATLSGVKAFFGLGFGYTGKGYADYQNPSNDYIEFTLNTKSATAGNILNLRYANGTSANRPLELRVNGVIVDTQLDFPATGSWTTWAISHTNAISLVSGANKIRLTAIGFGGGNIDNMSLGSIATSSMPRPDHIIFVWMENHGYKQVIGSSNAPYINSLRAKGTLFTNSYALAHPSYPNYINFFSGTNQGITTNVCITNRPFSTPNLYTQLKAVGKTFAWYSESLPATGSLSCSSGDYTVHHNPTTVFNNVPATQNKTWAQFPTDYTKLENVVCISPSKLHDMHDGSNPVLVGDTWIKNNLSALAEWCRTHNSIFVVYTDEDEDTEGNHIPVVAVGQHVKANYQLGTRYDHFNWTKTISSMMNAKTLWTTNLSNRNSITGCWQ